MAQPAKVDHKDWIHGINMVEEKDTRKLPSDLHTGAMACVCTHIHTHTINVSVIIKSTVSIDRWLIISAEADLHLCMRTLMNKTCVRECCDRNA